MCGSFGGGGTACEVESDSCPLVGVDFQGSMEVDLGVEIYKLNKKNERGRGKGGQIVRGEKK